MENNKAYLKKIHWVFLVGLVQALILVFLPDWFRLVGDTGKITASILGILINSAPFIALGIVTSRWRGAGAALILSLALVVAEVVLTYDNTKIGSLRYVILFTFNMPLVLFFAVEFGWVRKLPAIYFLGFVGSAISVLGYYSPNGLNNVLGFWTYPHFITMFFTISSRVAGFIVLVIFFCELINFMQDKEDFKKTTLLNPGNEYDKLNGLITFWALKVMIVSTILGVGYYVYSYLAMSRNRWDATNESYQIYFRIIGLFYIVVFLLVAVLLTWYLRKFLIEYFTSYNINSKLLYWLSIIPLIGLPLFAILQIEHSKQEEHAARVNSIGSFAASSSTVISAIFFIVYILRLIMRIAGGESAFIVSLVLSLFLLVWIMAHRSGYYVAIGLNLLVLVVGLVVIAMARWDAAEIPILFSLFLFNLMQLTLIFPIYHFEEFEYIPVPDSDPEKPGEFHLFG